MTGAGFRALLAIPDTDDEALVEALRTDGVTGWEWATAAIVMVAAIILSRVLKWLITRVLDRRLDRALATLIARLVGYLVLAVGAIYALDSLGVRIGPILGALGIAGIAVAFALKDILENFVAGILLQLQRPFTYGDQIQVDDIEGTVIGVDSRVVTVRTPDGETVFVPSATVIKADINNYTQLGHRRTDVPVGVAYGTDLRRAAEVLGAAARSADGVLTQPEPEVLLEGFGDSSIDFVVRYWHAPTIADFWNVRNAVALEIDRALADADITIPFPQRSVWWMERDES